MNTPIYDFLKTYTKVDSLRCHMPGHKGRGIEEKLCYPLDITEISNADSLFEAQGIILESERHMSLLYGTTATFYSTCGSTLCIQGMLAAVKAEGRTVIAVRNVHRAFLNAVALLDLEVMWILPKFRNGILSGEIVMTNVENILRTTSNAALYVTSPDYTGRTADISALAYLCSCYNVVLIVDNAHGAHLRFFEPSCHPISMGADMCCDSAHKMLPALTGAAMLHTSSPKYATMLRQYMSIFASTSPSYLVMASLDLCCRYIDEKIRNDIAVNIRYIEDFHNHFEGCLTFVKGDPFHITIDAAENGFDGIELAQLLRDNGVECEYFDNWIVILLMSPINVAEDYERLTVALDTALSKAIKNSVDPIYLSPVLPKRAMSIREAVFSTSEVIPVDKAEGRICASLKIPCSPSIPIVASGEIIDRNCINVFKNYGISDVFVVKF